MAARIALMIALLLAVAAPAAAHDPIFLTGEQRTAQEGPLLPDGTVSFALYGAIGGRGDSRGFQLRLAAGDTLVVELLIPDREPERSLPDADLPVVTVTAPDGSVTELAPATREPFDEPFSRTSYVRLADLSEGAQAGTYDVQVTGAAAARFTVAVGTRERFGTPVERAPNRVSSFAAIAGPLAEWYGAAPAAAEAEPPAGRSRMQVVALAAGGLVAAVVGGRLLRRALRRQA